MSTPYEQLQIDKAERLREKIAAEIKAEKWYIRLGSEAYLKDCLASMKDFSLAQEDIPFIIKLVDLEVTVELNKELLVVACNTTEVPLTDSE